MVSGLKRKKQTKRQNYEGRITIRRRRRLWRDKSESQAEMGGAGKSGKIHFSAKIIFLPSFRPASNQKVQSNCVNPMLLVKMQANRMQIL
jgi:hypothetical protein